MCAFIRHNDWYNVAEALNKQLYVFLNGFVMLSWITMICYYYMFETNLNVFNEIANDLIAPVFEVNINISYHIVSVRNKIYFEFTPVRYKNIQLQEHFSLSRMAFEVCINKW